MSKSICGAFLVLLSLTGLPVWAQSEAPSFDELAPENVVLYWEYDASAHKHVEYPNFEEAMQLWLESLNDILEVRVVRDEWQAILDRVDAEALEQAWGDHSALAVTGLGDNLTQLPGVIMICDILDAEVVRTFGIELFQKVASLSSQMKYEEELFRGHMIYSVYPPGRIAGLSLSFSIQDNLLVVSTSRPLLLECLDRLAYPDESLAGNPDYQMMREAFADSGADAEFYFVNNAQMKKSMDQVLGTVQEGGAMIPGMPTELPPEVQEILASSQSIIQTLWMNEQAATGYQVMEDGIERYPARSVIAATGALPHMQTMLKRQPAEPFWEDYLPRDTASFIAGNIYGPNDIWMLANNMLSGPQLPELKWDFGFAEVGISRATGETESYFDSIYFEMTTVEAEETVLLDMKRDLFGWMGNEWCFAQPLMDLQSVLPINQALLMLEVNDEAACRASLMRLEEQLLGLAETGAFKMNVEESTHRGVAFTTYIPSIPMLPVTPISPSWCIHEGRLLITTKAALMRDMIDVKVRGRGGLERNRYYEELRDVYAQPAHLVTFQDVEADFYTQRDTLRRMSSISELFGESKNMMPLLVMDRAAYLLGILQVYKANAYAAVVKDDRWQSEERLLYYDLPGVPSADMLVRTPVSLGLEPFVHQWALASAEAGNTDRAIRLYDNLVQNRPTSAVYLEPLADLYVKQDEAHQAIEMFNRCIETMPETSLVVAREAIRPDVSATDIVRNIQMNASKTQRVDPAAAIFGVAMKRLRDPSLPQTQVETELLDNVHNLYPNSIFAQAARRELSMMDQSISGTNQSEMLDTLEAEASETPITIDGVIDEPVWDQAKSTQLDGNIHLYLAEHQQEVYGVLAMPKDATSATAPVEITMDLSPQRDYVQFWRTGFDIQQNQQDSMLSLKPVTYEVIDPYDLMLEVEMQSALAGLPGEVRFMVESLMPTPEYQPARELGQLELEAALGEAPGLQVIEFGFNIQQGGATNLYDAWNFDLRVVKENGEVSLVQSLSGDEGIDPFTYPILRLPN